VNFHENTTEPLNKVDMVEFLILRPDEYDHSDIKTLKYLINKYQLTPLEYYRLIHYVKDDSFSMTVIGNSPEPIIPISITIPAIKMYSRAEEYERESVSVEIGKKLDVHFIDVIKGLISGFVPSPMVEIFDSLGISRVYLSNFDKESTYLLANIRYYFRTLTRPQDLPRPENIDFKTRNIEEKNIYKRFFPSPNQTQITEFGVDLFPITRNDVSRSFLGISLEEYTDDELFKWIGIWTDVFHEKFEKRGRFFTLWIASMIIQFLILGDPLDNSGNFIKTFKLEQYLPKVKPS